MLYDQVVAVQLQAYCNSLDIESNFQCSNEKKSEISVRKFSLKIPCANIPHIDTRPGLRNDNILAFGLLNMVSIYIYLFFRKLDGSRVPMGTDQIGKVVSSLYNKYIDGRHTHLTVETFDVLLLLHNILGNETQPFLFSYSRQHTLL